MRSLSQLFHVDAGDPKTQEGIQTIVVQEEEKMRQKSLA
jgi:hypothetical protein